MNIKRLTLFSFYDPANQVDDYVIHYLEELHKVSDIIFSSDGLLSDCELIKIRHLVIQICQGLHGEYDFGSHKRAYLKAKELDILSQYDWLIIANDSCYGPFEPLNETLSKMETKNADFWGFSYNSIDVVGHLQSYFVSMNKKCFLLDSFDKFITRVEKQDERKNVVFLYEHQLTQALIREGLTFTSFFQEQPKKFLHDPAKNWDLMIKKGFPFIKRTLFTRNPYNLNNIDSFKTVIKSQFPKYNIRLIEDNLSRYPRKEYVKVPLRLKVKKGSIEFLKTIKKSIKTVLKRFNFMK